MTATTTIRIDDELNARIAASAAEAGKTPDAFIVDAIIESVEQAEEDRDFHRLANERWADFQATGVTVPWAEAKAWLEARARGERSLRPGPRPFKA